MNSSSRTIALLQESVFQRALYAEHIIDRGLQNVQKHQMIMYIFYNLHGTITELDTLLGHYGVKKWKDMYVAPELLTIASEGKRHGNVSHLR